MIFLPPRILLAKKANFANCISENLSQRISLDAITKFHHISNIEKNVRITWTLPCTFSDKFDDPQIQ